MSGCLVGLIVSLVAAVLMFGLRVLTTIVTVMFMSIASLFVGVGEAVDRIADSWIDGATGAGVAIGYNPDTRDGVRFMAGLLLVIGWAIDIWVIWQIVTLVAN